MAAGGGMAGSIVFSVLGVLGVRGGVLAARAPLHHGGPGARGVAGGGVGAAVGAADGALVRGAVDGEAQVCGADGGCRGSCRDGEELAGLLWNRNSS